MVKRSRPLPDDEIRKLSRLWRQNGDREALKRVVTSNLGLANLVAVKHRNWGVPLEDVFQESVLGLIRGCELYDPERPERIGTYVHWWCRAFVMKMILKQKSSLHGVDGKIARAIGAVSRRATRRLSTEEIAALIGRKVEDVERAMVNRQDHLSLDSLLRWEERGEREDKEGQLLVDALPRPDEVVIVRDHRAKLGKRVAAALARLAPRDAHIVRRRYMADDEDDDATLQDLGDELGLSRERVRQLEQKAMQKLRKYLKAAA